jgi:hypothetical protein
VRLQRGSFLANTWVPLGVLLCKQLHAAVMCLQPITWCGRTSLCLPWLDLLLLLLLLRGRATLLSCCAGSSLCASPQTWSQASSWGLTGEVLNSGNMIWVEVCSIEIDILNRTKHIKQKRVVLSLQLSNES